MLPLYPPYPFVDLAKEHLGIHQRQARRHHHHLGDLSAKLPERQPDPVHLGLRWVVASGPIGALAAWINRKITEREDRTSGSRIDPLMSASTVTELTVLLNAPLYDQHVDQHEQKLAA